MDSTNSDYIKYVKISSFVSCLLFMLAHVLYLILFSIIRVRPLIIINSLSILFYIIMLVLIKTKHYTSYVILTGLEIAYYMTAASICCGVQPGFDLCFIALLTLVFFAYYFSKFASNKIKPLFLSGLYVALFCFCYIWHKFNPPLVEIPDVASTILFVFHIIVVFGFTISFLWVLVNYTIKLDKKIRNESKTDTLTNIPNRKGLEEYFDKIDGQRGNYVLAFFDIDNFKIFNDINGHICGDYVLENIAKLAKDNSLYDYTARWGGEEFVVIAKIEDDIDNTFNKIDNIRQKIENFDFLYDNKILKSTVTIGIAEYEEGFSLDDWIDKADKLLYEGKNNGKNQTVI